ncbi:hypothetical protein [Paenibacillus tarimensis]|uniref:hypothetical protein n=1 Tax=Paenibacillus tarimensis TaxID=416012 RepID=UPI001F45CE81|nr:hypothetical protein [Paenibacillus tarimensis]MCF2944223.1 hypothetical protein [Paenibacillus tarimensis]
MTYLSRLLSCDYVEWKQRLTECEEGNVRSLLSGYFSEAELNEMTEVLTLNHWLKQMHSEAAPSKLTIIFAGRDIIAANPPNLPGIDRLPSRDACAIIEYLKGKFATYAAMLGESLIGCRLHEIYPSCYAMTAEITYSASRYKDQRSCI